MITTGFWACARVFPGRTKGPTAATAAARVATWMKPRRLTAIVGSFSRNACPGSWVSIARLPLLQSTVARLSAASRDGVRRSARPKHGRLGTTDARAPPPAIRMVAEGVEDLSHDGTGHGFVPRARRRKSKPGGTLCQPPRAVKRPDRRKIRVTED